MIAPTLEELSYLRRLTPSRRGYLVRLGFVERGKPYLTDAGRTELQRLRAVEAEENKLAWAALAQHSVTITAQELGRLLVAAWDSYNPIEGEVLARAHQQLVAVVGNDALPSHLRARVEP